MPERSNDSQRASRIETPLGAQAELNADRSERASAKFGNSLSPSVENSIQFVPEIEKRVEATSEASTKEGDKPNSDSTALTMPEHIATRYVQAGRKFHFTNGDLAFSYTERRLSTPLENTEVISDLIAIAKENGWNNVALTGTSTFRKEAWQQANLAGLTVRGYRASELEVALVERKREERGLSQGSRDGTAPSGPSEKPTPEPPSATKPASEAARTAIEDRPRDRVYTGRLVGHGSELEPARNSKPSYYVRLETEDDTKTLWGEDLKRALAQSLSQPDLGASVTVRHLASRPSGTNRYVQDGEGRIVKIPARADVDRFSVERVDFLESRRELAAVLRDEAIDAKTAVSAHPQLAGSYTEIHVARLKADELYAKPEDRERFVQRVRQEIANEIARGEPLSVTRVSSRARDEFREPRNRDLVEERALG
jgi:hypothetical protein